MQDNLKTFYIQVFFLLIGIIYLLIPNNVSDLVMVGVDLDTAQRLHQKIWPLDSFSPIGPVHVYSTYLVTKILGIKATSLFIGKILLALIASIYISQLKTIKHYRLLSLIPWIIALMPYGYDPRYFANINIYNYISEILACLLYCLSLNNNRYKYVRICVAVFVVCIKPTNIFYLVPLIFFLSYREFILIFTIALLLHIFL